MQSGIASLPTSCSGAAWRSSVTCPAGSPSPSASLRRDMADALGVLVGLVVAVLGRDRQLAQRLGARVVELARALGDVAFPAHLRVVGELVLGFVLCGDVARDRVDRRPPAGDAEALHSSQR